VQEFKPIKFKYRKYHNFLIFKKLKKKEFTHFKLKEGDFGLKIGRSSIINSKQISSFLKLIKRYCKKDYTLFLYCFPNVAITAKSISVRMGKGIGSIINWIFVIKKNNVFFEIEGELTFPLWILLKKSKNKLPFLSTIIFRKKLKKK